MTNLEKVRKKLIELEDVIIRGLCSRANYHQNLVIYEHAAPPISLRSRV